ncbi:MAG: hypothetical protein ACRD1T_13260, partial [Acidimicrobiia bacterium]
MRFFLAAYVSAILLLTGIAIAGGVVVYRAGGPDDATEAAAADHGYDLVSWELRHLPEKWLHKAQHVFDAPSEDEASEALCRYFQPAAGGGERRPQKENEVEDIIEGRVTSVLEDEGLALEPPLFSDLGLLFPPVDFELDATPRVLAISPRERIELRDSYLLKPDLAPAVIEEIERDSEADNAGESGVSALVIRTGGFSSYPSVVFEDASYESLVETVFHEWLHSYLIFFPLGAAYFGSDEARTLNESVANIGGRELATRYSEQYGSLEEACGAPIAATTPSPGANGFDFTSEMRELRRQVEAMLAEGRIDEAETLMETRRDEFEAKGISIRKLNQAYFAFHGFYADTAASIDPIGPKLQTLFEQAGSAGEFVRMASQITSRVELE